MLLVLDGSFAYSSTEIRIILYCDEEWIVLYLLFVFL